MKLKSILLCPLFLALLLPLYAQESATDDSTAEEEKELPEFSHPPYSVGDRAIIQGYYAAPVDGISLNFRVLNNRMFVYWVDEDDLIVEPQALSGNVRFLAGVRGKNFYAMEPLQGEAGLGSVGVDHLKKNGVPVEYVLFEDEGHTFRKLETSLLVASRMERFLHKHFGGRVCH